MLQEVTSHPWMNGRLLLDTMVSEEKKDMKLEHV